MVSFLGKKRRGWWLCPERKVHLFLLAPRMPSLECLNKSLPIQLLSNEAMSSQEAPTHSGTRMVAMLNSKNLHGGLNL